MKLSLTTPIRWITALLISGAAAAFGQIDISSFTPQCNGSDESALAQAAINATPSGGTLTISCQLGIGASGIVLADKTNVTILGSTSSAGFRALAPTGQGAGGFASVLFVVRNCSGCVIKDLVIDSQNVSAAGVGFDRCTGSTLQNVSVSNTAYPASAAIVASGGNGNRYLGNTVRFTGKISSDGTRGMWIGNGGAQTEQNATIANNTVSDTGATGIAAHVNNSVIRDNLVTNAYGSGIKITPTTGLGGQSSLEGNTVRGNRFHGVQISKADTPVIVQRNTIDANTLAGVYTADGVFYGRITGNTITNNAEAGVYLYNGDGVDIDNNRIAGNGHGVLIETNNGYRLHDLRVIGNFFDGQKANGVSVFGRGGTMDNVSVTGNSIVNGLRYGVYIEQTKGKPIQVSVSSNCYSNNAWGTILDTRGQIPPAPPSSSCTTPNTGGDTTAPTVSVTAPANGATVQGTIALSADASDNVGIAGVQFQLNGSAYGPKLTMAPYTTPWDSRTVGNGNYQWNAVAQDAAGNTAVSATVAVAVNNPDTIAPSVYITAPAAGSTISGNVTLRATASDNVGVAGVQFLVDGAPHGQEATSGYTVSLKTGTLPDGPHTIGAIARDAAGNRTAAQTVAVTVANGKR